MDCWRLAHTTAWVENSKGEERKREMRYETGKKYHTHIYIVSINITIIAKHLNNIHSELSYDVTIINIKTTLYIYSFIRFRTILFVALFWSSASSSSSVCFSLSLSLSSSSCFFFFRHFLSSLSFHWLAGWLVGLSVLLGSQYTRGSNSRNFLSLTRKHRHTHSYMWMWLALNS